MSVLPYIVDAVATAAAYKTINVIAIKLKRKPTPINQFLGYHLPEPSDNGWKLIRGKTDIVRYDYDNAKFIVAERATNEKWSPNLVNLACVWVKDRDGHAILASYTKRADTYLTAIDTAYKERLILKALDV